MKSVRSLRIAVTADLHYGTRHTAGNQATEQLAQYLRANRPDVILLAGDIGAGEDFQRCLALFDGIDCIKGLVPGNHDVWVRLADVRGNSKQVYEEYLPKVSREHGFQYLDHASLQFPESDLAIAGSMNWYDYTWDHELLQQATPDWQERLQTKRFTRGQHNDANFVRWPWSDPEFTTIVYDRFKNQLEESLANFTHTAVVMHHPPIKGLLYPAKDPPTLDGLLWRAFSGNTRVEELLLKWAERIPAVWCGHTHSARHCQEGPMRGFNIGGDYEFKRLQEFDWPSGEIRELDFLS